MFAEVKSFKLKPYLFKYFAAEATKNYKVFYSTYILGGGGGKFSLGIGSGFFSFSSNNF